MSINLQRRQLSKALAIAGSPLSSVLKSQTNDLAQTRIAFGSCLHQDKPQPVWQAVLATDPGYFIFLGDNIYGDTDDPLVLRDKYAQLASQPGFVALRKQSEVFAIWDDHDYGRNDAGREYPMKEASRREMLSFWQEPEESPRWTRPDGIYTSSMIEEHGRTVQVILLDLRWNRSPLLMVDSEEAWLQREAMNMGPYLINDDFSATLLGEAQWQWLEEQLNQPADLRIIGSSIQLLAEFTGWETWANFPHERDRFIHLISQHQASPVFLISGDVHWCEISQLEHEALKAPLIELTSSGLTETWDAISPNMHRISPAYAVQNFGLITIDWGAQGPRVLLEARDTEANVLVSTEYPRL